ncbi:MAG: mechanosensitive ion channel family protein [Xenococcaceae cyanobacterium]
MTHNRDRRPSQSSKSLQIIGIIIALLLALLLTPAMAQSSKGAPVVLDGRKIFQVSSSEQFPAQGRADWINSQLQAVVESQKPPDIRIEIRNQSPTILIDDRYLLTVTQRDAVFGSTPEEQAKIWSEQIRKAVQKAQKERRIQFLWWASLLVAGAVLLAIALHWGLGRLWRRWERRAPQILVSDGESDEYESRALKLFLDLTLLLARATLWVAVALYATNLFPITRQWSYNIANSLIASFTSPILSFGQNSYSVIDFLILIGLLLGLVVFAGTVTNFLRFRVLRLTAINRGAQEVIATVTKYTLISIGAIVLLQVWGLDLSSLTILASALGVGIGFGFQNIARNFGSGIVLIFERPIQVGDFIEVDEYMGTVERIGGRSTLIRTLDQVSIIVPNSRFLESEVINWSHLNPVSRLHLPVGVAYHSDVNVVQKALLEAASDCPDVLSDPQPQVFFKGFGNSALDFELLVWIADPSKQPAIKSNMYFHIAAALRRHQIEIPFPQRDLHIRSGSSERV